MSHKFGFPALTNRAINGNPPKNFSGNRKKPLIVRVTDIIMDENHPLIKNGTYGLNSLGLIIGYGTRPNNFGKTYTALPSNSNTKKYPTVNEHVELIQSTIPNSNGIQWLYQEPLGLYGTSTPNGNQFPSVTQDITPPSQNLDYTQIGTGAINIVDNQPQEIIVNSLDNPSQATFVEKSNIHPLMPFEGDIIHEGRYGNSLRFGSTSKSQSKYKNNWSEGGNNGDPITILRNGQPTNSTDEGWIPITENINNDLASIYLTSNQKIPFNLSQPNLISYNGSAPDPKTFTSPQIILNSTRIILNAKTDNVLISGQQSVSLSSIKSVNIDAPKTIIQSSNIFLGDSNAVERGVMGDTLYNKLDVVLESLITLVRVLEVQQLWPGGLAAPDGGMMTTSSTVKSQLTNIKTTLTEILSKTVKTT
jgi:hypothetical protein